MNRANYVLIAGLAAIWLAAAPRLALGQSSWPGYPNNGAISVTSGGNVGIGTAPVTSFQVQNNLGGAFGGGATDQTVFIKNINAGNTATVLTLAPNSGSNFNIGIFGSGASPANGVYIDQRNNAPLFFLTNDTEAMRITGSGNIGIGTANPQSKLAVNGNITAKDVMVTNTGWADHVFRPGYNLRPLREVGEYIRENHHLPEIPSEAEVKEKGVSLGDMQAKLLAKIEELTLHMIQADDRNDRLEQQNREFRERIARLEKEAAAAK